MKLLIINGPNLNLLGKRQPDFYGSVSFDDYLNTLKEKYKEVELSYFQSNAEGAIIDKLHEAEGKFEGIILNGAAYTHTSIAIADAIQAISLPVVEVHISNIYAREEFRRHSFTAAHCKGVITGLGLKGYELALQFFLEKD